MDDIPLYEWGEARYMRGPCHMCDTPSIQRYKQRIELNGQGYSLLLCRRCTDRVFDRQQQRGPELKAILDRLTVKFAASRKRDKS